MKQNRKNAFYLVFGIALVASFSAFYSRTNKSTFRPSEPDDIREATTKNIDSAVEEVTEEPVDPSSRIVDAFFESDDDFSGSSSVEEHDHILREWRGSLNPSPEDLRERLKSLKPGDKFTMSLPSIGQTELTITKAGAIGATLCFVAVPSGEVTPLPVGLPDTPAISGHSTWAGPSGRVVFTTAPGVHESPLPGTGVYRLTPGEARPVQIVSGQPFNHLAVSDDGRFFIADDYRTQTIHIGSVETGRFLKLCDSHTRQGRPQYTHAMPT